MSEVTRQIGRIQQIIQEWDKGCSNGAAGTCASCSEGALRAIESLLLSERTQQVLEEAHGPAIIGHRVTRET